MLLVARNGQLSHALPMHCGPQEANKEDGAALGTELAATAAALRSEAAQAASAASAASAAAEAALQERLAGLEAELQRLLEASESTRLAVAEEMAALSAVAESGPAQVEPVRPLARPPACRDLHE